MLVPQDQIARAHRQAEEALQDSAVALKQQERLIRLLQDVEDSVLPELEDARRALKILRKLTHNTLIRVKAAQVNLLGIPIENQIAGRQTDHDNRDT